MVTILGISNVVTTSAFATTGAFVLGKASSVYLSVFEAKVETSLFEFVAPHRTPADCIALAVVNSPDPMSNSPFTFLPAETTKQPKSPKSPRATLENPLLKSSSLFFPAPPLVPEHEKNLELVTPSRAQKPVRGTPGPPPKASLSLNLKLGNPSKETSLETSTKAPIPKPSASPGKIFSDWDESPNSGFSNLNGNWVVAYGYRNDREADELLSILREYGPILSTKSNANWIAVQFADGLSAAHASARQIVRVGASLCGVSKTSTDLMHELIAETVNAPCDRRESSLSKVGNNASLGEEDILAGYSMSGGPRSLTNRPKSVCEKIFYWYFDWDMPTEKDHSD